MCSLGWLLILGALLTAAEPGADSESKARYLALARARAAATARQQRGHPRTPLPQEHEAEHHPEHPRHQGLVENSVRQEDLQVFSGPRAHPGAAQAPPPNPKATADPRTKESKAASPVGGGGKVPSRQHDPRALAKQQLANGIPETRPKRRPEAGPPPSPGSIDGPEGKAALEPRGYGAEKCTVVYEHQCKTEFDQDCQTRQEVMADILVNISIKVSYLYKQNIFV